MKLLLVLLGLVTLTAAQFNQGRFNNRRSFIRFDDDDFDDFDDFFDLDDHDDSLEDIYEDLYDDDADDRAEARAKLTRLRASGAITGTAFRNNRFVNNRRNSGFNQGGSSNLGFGGSRGFNTPRPSFNTPRPSFNNPRPSFNTARPSFNNQRSSFNNVRPTQRPSRTFTPQPSFTQRTTFTPRPAFTQRPSFTQRGSINNNPGFNTGFTQGQSRFNTNSAFNRPQPVTSFPKRNFGSTPAKFSNTNAALNTVNTGSNRKHAGSPFKNAPGGFNWPGGNGYFFSMSTNGAKPVSYFIKYDD